MNVVKYLEGGRFTFDVIPHHPTYSAQRLAQELHVPGREVAKTVLLRADGLGEYVVAALPANRTVDLERVAKLLGKGKPELATEQEIAKHCPDCELGALPPFGSQYGMKTIVDSRLAEDEQIVFESNTHDEAIRMRFDEFRKLEHPIVGPIAAER
jgi:Ala-tRNA(Pro) deacylase